MTPGQRMVWAAVFAEQRGADRSVVESVRRAALEVKNLGTLATGTHRGLLTDDADAREMLDDMIEVRR